MLNKYRRIEYTDDGCTLYECLKCKAKWECRNFWNVYCGKCGTKWDGELEWEEEKSGAYRRVLAGSHWSEPKPHAYAEYRFMYLNNETGEWEKSPYSGWQYVPGSDDWSKFRESCKNKGYSYLLVELASAMHDIKAHIKKDAEDSFKFKDMANEYRIVKKRGYGSTILQVYPIGLVKLP